MNREKTKRIKLAESRLRRMIHLFAKRDRLFGVGTTDEIRNLRKLLESTVFYLRDIDYPNGDPDEFLRYTQMRLEGWLWVFGKLEGEEGEDKPRATKYREAGRAVRDYLKTFSHTRLLGFYYKYSDETHMAKGRYSYLWDIPYMSVDDFIIELYTDIEHNRFKSGELPRRFRWETESLLKNAVRVGNRAERIDMANAQGLIKLYLPDDAPLRAIYKPYHIPCDNLQSYIDEADHFYWQWAYKGNRL